MAMELRSAQRTFAASSALADMERRERTVKRGREGRAVERENARAEESIETAVIRSSCMLAEGGAEKKCKEAQMSAITAA